MIQLRIDWRDLVNMALKLRVPLTMELVIWKDSTYFTNLNLLQNYYIVLVYFALSLSCNTYLTRRGNERVIHYSFLSLITFSLHSNLFSRGRYRRQWLFLNIPFLF